MASWRVLADECKHLIDGLFSPAFVEKISNGQLNAIISLTKKCWCVRDLNFRKKEQKT